MELLTLLPWPWTELESKNSTLVSPFEEMWFSIRMKFLSLIHFSFALKTDRAHKPGESCGPLSESSWCVWGEFANTTRILLIIWMCSRSLFTYSQSLFILCRMKTASVRQLNFWEKPPDCWSGWEGKGTEHNVTHSQLWLPFVVLIMRYKFNNYQHCYVCIITNNYTSAMSLLICLLLCYWPGWMTQQLLCRKRRICTKRLRTFPCVLRWVHVLFRFCVYFQIKIFFPNMILYIHDILQYLWAGCLFILTTVLSVLLFYLWFIALFCFFFPI